MPRGPDKKKRKQRSDTKPRSWHQYCQHRGNAEKGGIGFLLTYGEWLQIWEASGHLHERGCRKGQYVMARTGDKGPYAVGNVRITTVEDNLFEEFSNEETRARMSVASSIAQTGKRHPESVKVKLRVARRKQIPPFLGRQWSAEHRAKNRSYWERRRAEKAQHV